MVLNTSLAIASLLNILRATRSARWTSFIWWFHRCKHLQLHRIPGQVDEKGCFAESEIKLEHCQATVEEYSVSILKQISDDLQSYDNLLYAGACFDHKLSCLLV